MIRKLLLAAIAAPLLLAGCDTGADKGATAPKTRLNVPEGQHDQPPAPPAPPEPPK